MTIATWILVVVTGSWSYSSTTVIDTYKSEAACRASLVQAQSITAPKTTKIEFFCLPSYR